ncbi:transposase [Evansella sp. AB-rgal1]|uniref:transposase n=1 Tax=Evansella sp. AB-rgal1 TaxID=3242696 RepID=UPI00359D1C8A
MPYKRRDWIPDTFYHITARGNRKENIFHEDSDFRWFLQNLETTYIKLPFELSSYCLMSNHYHLLIKAPLKTIPNVMFYINKKYADYYNKKYKCHGHLFEKRYFDKPVYGTEGLLKVSSYIHANPCEAGMVEDIYEYPWSSITFFSPSKLIEVPPYFSYTPLIDSFPGDEETQKNYYRMYLEIGSRCYFED